MRSWWVLNRFDTHLFSINFASSSSVKDQIRPCVILNVVLLLDEESQQSRLNAVANRVHILNAGTGIDA